MTAKMISKEPLPDEKDYVARARAGDKDAYRYLVEGYQDRLFRLVLSMVPRREQAEDLTQEIFVKAYFALQSFEGNSAFYTWLFRIASNHCLDHLRRRQLAEVSLDAPRDENEELSLMNQMAAPESEHPEATVSQDSEVLQMLDALTGDQRQILSLRELEGYSYEEMAAILKCNVNTVKSRLNRAREALRTIYIRKYGNIPELKPVQENEEIG